MGQRLPSPDFLDCLFQFVIGSVEVGTKRAKRGNGKS